MTDDLLRHLAPNGSMSVLPTSHDVNRLAHLSHVDYKKKTFASTRNTLGLASFVAGTTMTFDFFVPTCRGIASYNTITSGIGPDRIPAI